VVLGDVSIDNWQGDAVLTIPAGMEIRFKSDAGLFLNWGRLNAVGKSDSMIVFTSESGLTQGWDGIAFSDGTDINGRISNLRYCVIEKAGQGGFGRNANIYCLQTNQPILRNCIIRQATAWGFVSWRLHR